MVSPSLAHDHDLTIPGPRSWSHHPWPKITASPSLAHDPCLAGVNGVQLWLDCPGLKDRVPSSAVPAASGGKATPLTLSYTYAVEIGSAARDELVSNLGTPPPIRTARRPFELPAAHSNCPPPIRTARRPLELPAAHSNCGPRHSRVQSAAAERRG
jgi:hypothetical protein